MTSPRTLAILTRRDDSLSAKAARISLAAMRPGYALATATRNVLFDRHLRRIHRLDRPVISVGNLTTGGTGKTPMVIRLAHQLVEMGARPAVLLRGYRVEPREDIQSSDETQVLMQALGPAIPVEPDPDRLAAAQRVILKHPKVNVFLLDDGFQHRRVHRDLDLVLIDATLPFGCALPLPAGYRKAAQLPLGLLRESPRNLQRADGVIITRADQVSADQLEQLKSLVVKLTGQPPIACASHQWTGLLDQHDQPAPLDSLRDTDVATVCGIANPESFLDAARRYASRIALACALRDHQPYDHKLIHDVFARAQVANAQAILMTEKDWVKCRTLIKDPPLPIYRPVLEIQWLDGGETVGGLLSRTIAHEDEMTTSA